jgi:hypothetical protein
MTLRARTLRKSRNAYKEITEDVLFHPVAKKPVLLKYENFFEKNSHPNLNFVEVPTFFHKVVSIVRPFLYLESIEGPAAELKPAGLLVEREVSEHGQILYSTKANLNVYRVLTF